MDPELISTCELIWAWVQCCLCEQVPQGLSLTPSACPSPPSLVTGTGEAQQGLGLTFQVRLLSREETNHSLQLAEFSVVRINVSDAVNPGGKETENPKGQRETTVKTSAPG